MALVSHLSSLLLQISPVEENYMVNGLIDSKLGIKSSISYSHSHLLLKLKMKAGAQISRTCNNETQLRCTLQIMSKKNNDNTTSQFIMTNNIHPELECLMNYTNETGRT